MKILRADKKDYEDNLQKFIPFFSQMRNMSMLEKLHLWHPPTDVLETAEYILITCELAGIRKEDINIQLENTYLIIRGERREPRIPSKAIYHNLEIFYGPFERMVKLPNDVNLRDIKALYTDGFLKITLYKGKSKKSYKRSVKID